MISVMVFKAHSFLWGVDPYLVREVLTFPFQRKLIDWQWIFSNFKSEKNYSRALLLDNISPGDAPRALPVAKILGPCEIPKTDVKKISHFLRPKERKPSLLGVAFWRDSLCFLLDVEKITGKVDRI